MLDDPKKDIFCHVLLDIIRAILNNSKKKQDERKAVIFRSLVYNQYLSFNRLRVLFIKASNKYGLHFGEDKRTNAIVKLIRSLSGYVLIHEIPAYVTNDDFVFGNLSELKLMLSQVENLDEDQREHYSTALGILIDIFETFAVYIQERQVHIRREWLDRYFYVTDYTDIQAHRRLLNTISEETDSPLKREVEQAYYYFIKRYFIRQNRNSIKK